MVRASKKEVHEEARSIKEGKGGRCPTLRVNDTAEDVSPHDATGP